MLFGMGWTELMVIVAVAVLVAGPALIRGGAKRLSQSLREGRKAITEVKSAIESEEDKQT